MNWIGQALAVRWARKGVCMLAVAVACSGAMAQQALAAQVQAYIIFQLDASSSVSVTTAKLGSTSLGNCLQLVIGSHLLDVFVHVACDESGNRDETNNLNQALVDLSRVDGIARSTIVSLMHGAD
jgi:hypothetical protein